MNKKFLGLILIIVVIVGAILFFVLGDNGKKETVDKEPEVVEEVDETPGYTTHEEVKEAQIELGKQNGLTEEEMTQMGKDLFSKLQENLNIKSLDEYDEWYNEVMLTDNAYELFKDYLTLGDTELVSVDFKDVQVVANSPHSFQWTGTMITTFKAFGEGMLYTQEMSVSSQIATNDTVNEYKIYTYNTELLSSNKVPLE